LRIETFKKIVRDRAGLSFDNIREDLLRSAIEAALARCRLGSHADLAAILQEDHGEFLCFVKDLTINETFFFREPRYLDLLTKRLVKDVEARKGVGDRVRILSAGCSTGEEPYSLAMALMEEYGRIIGHRFSITGCDIDIDALAVARDGVYSRLSFRGVAPAMVEKYFSEDGVGKCSLARCVRDAVAFRQANLGGGAADPLLMGMDIIFYRNVSLYFDAETQRRIFADLASLLAPGGYLVMASSETFAHDLGILPMVEIDGLFLFRKPLPPAAVEPAVAAREWRETARRAACAGSAAALAPARPARAVPASSVPPAGSRARHDATTPFRGTPRDPGDTLDAARERVRAKDYAGALAICDRMVSSDRAVAGPHLVRADVLFRLNRADEAEGACRAAVDCDDLLIDAYILLAMIAKHRGDAEAAVGHLEKAVYIDPSCWVAHFHLGELYAGDARKAARKYETVVRIIEREAGDDADKGGRAFIPLNFGKREVLQACRMRLARLEGIKYGA
jgi:chemotaxis protein methyltransferase CheR